VARYATRTGTLPPADTAAAPELAGGASADAVDAEIAALMLSKTTSEDSAASA